MDKPKIDTAAVYGTVADLLPTEGRDFTLDAAYDESGKTKIIVVPVTAIGRAWVPFLQKELSARLSGKGTTVTEGGAVSHDVMTVRSIRAAIENEADVALKKKIEDTNRRYLEADEAYRAAVKSNNGATGPDTAKLYRAADATREESQRLHRVSSKIATVRADLDAAAEKAAKEELKRGKDWSVDVDAPLTSLFDQQNATSRFKVKESVVYKIAEKLADIDELSRDGVTNLKQYILQKGA